MAGLSSKLTKLKKEITAVRYNGLPWTAIINPQQIEVAELEQYRYLSGGDSCFSSPSSARGMSSLMSTLSRLDFFSSYRLPPVSGRHSLGSKISFTG